MLDNLFEILDSFGKESVELLRQRHMQAGQKASGQAYDSFNHIIEEKEGGLKLIIGGTDYVYYLEHGRGAGKFPPPDAIKQWIQDKGLAAQFDKEYKLNSFAYLIGKKISEQGSFLHRNKQTYDGVDSPIGAVFSDDRMKDLKLSLQDALMFTIKSKIIKGEEDEFTNN